MFVDDSYDEKSPSFWRKNAQISLANQILKQRNYNIAKNVILFMGDGMSLPTVTAARIYSGQKQGFRGEESQLSFDQFPYVALSKVCLSVYRFEFSLILSVIKNKSIARRIALMRKWLILHAVQRLICVASKAITIRLV